jgi:hydroxyethylthiazole kinase
MGNERVRAWTGAEKEMVEQIATTFTRLRQERPLIHHITNFVTMNDVANVTLHVGAYPVMAHAGEEVAEMVAKAQALVLNTGTPTWPRLQAMLVAGRRANELRIPVVLDPVGVGATQMRRQANERLLVELDVAIVRGNAAEIGALAQAGGAAKGVESVAAVAQAAAVTRQLAQSRGMVVAMTGARDTASDGERLVAVDNGHQWLTTLTGTGCMVTAVMAAFAGMTPDPLLAAVAGLVTYGVAAQRAAERASGPASFKVTLFDTLYHLTADHILEDAQVAML